MSTTQRLLDAQGIPSTSFVNLLGGSDSLLPDTAGLARVPGAGVSDLEQTIDNQLGKVGATIPIDALRDPYGNTEPDGDELTDPRELSELPTVQGLAHQIPDIAHNPVVQAVNTLAGQVAGAASAVGGAVGLSHTVGDIVAFAHGVGSGQTLELPGQAIDCAAHSIDQGVADVADIGMNGHILAHNLINDAPGELLNGGPVDGLVGQLDHALEGLNEGPLVDVNVLPQGIMGSSGIFHATVDPSQPSLVTVDALAASHSPDSHLIDADALPKSLGDIANVSALTSPDAGEGAVGAVVGDGPSLLDANLLTGNLPNACQSGQMLDDLLQGSACGPEGLVGSLKPFGAIAEADVISDGVFGSPGVAHAAVDATQAALVTLNVLADDISQPSHIVDADALPKSLGQIANVSALTAPATGDGAIGAIVGNGSPTLLDVNVLTAADQIQIPNLGGAGADALAGVLNHDLGGIAQAAVAPAADLAGANFGTGGANCVALPAIDLHDMSQQVTNACPQVDLHSLV
jgi:hypothetical protein